MMPLPNDDSASHPSDGQYNAVKARANGTNHSSGVAFSWFNYSDWWGNDLAVGYRYWFVLLLLVAVILMIGVATSHQTQVRHELYRELSEARQAYHQMHVEQQKLIIEQQTFSATPIVAKRASSELKMFYPLESDRVVIAQSKPTAAMGAKTIRSK